MLQVVFVQTILKQISAYKQYVALQIAMNLWFFGMLFCVFSTTTHCKQQDEEEPGGWYFYLRKWVFKPVLYQSVILLGTNISLLCQRNILFPVLVRVLGQKKVEQIMCIYLDLTYWKLLVS